MSSVSIGKNVKQVGENAFKDCDALTKVIVTDLAAWCNIRFYSDINVNPLTKAHHLFSDKNTEITELHIPTTVKSIESFCFSGASYITSISIPNSVTSIGTKTFQDCTALSSVVIPSSVTTLGKAFSGCISLNEVTLNSDAIVSEDRKIISASLQYGYGYVDNSLTAHFGSQVRSFILGNGITKIGTNAFYNCTGLETISLPNSLKTISEKAFSGCENLKEIHLPDSIVNIASLGIPTVYVKRGTISLLTLWNKGYVPYEEGSQKQLEATKLEVGYLTQTTAKIIVKNIYEEFVNTYNDEPLSSDSIVFTGKRPEEWNYITIKVSLGDIYYQPNIQFTTSPIRPTVKMTSNTASSISALGSYTKGDAYVKSTVIKLNGKTFDGDSIFVNQLDPDKSYEAEYIVEVAYGENNSQTCNYSGKATISSLPLELTPLQPRVASPGNVVVAAQSNLDDEEENIGFEWRRTDWTDDFTSNSGTAYLYDGMMEGYIRNLNTEKLWKFRPYYESASGNRYYGEWMGLDPTNTSYFEPTVHTYAKVSVEGNSAEIKGYAMRGSDNVTEQGFKYWKQPTESNNAASRNASVKASDIPGNAMTVEASGQIMTVQLSGLEYETGYCYVAYIKTSEGETFYGELQTFRTDADVMGIGVVRTSNDKIEVSRYDIRGHRIQTPQRGLNIVRYADGTTKKIVVR